MSLIATALLEIAGGIAIPHIKKILTSNFGKGGELAGHVIDEIAGNVGIHTRQLEEVIRHEPNAVVEAMVAAEPRAAELWASYVESQRLTNESVALDYAKESWFAWAWRPAWMWLLGIMWFYTILLQPFAMYLVQDLGPVDVATLLAVTGIFTTLYMGGHTAKSLISTWREGR